MCENSVRCDYEEYKDGIGSENKEEKEQEKWKNGFFNILMTLYSSPFHSIFMVEIHFVSEMMNSIRLKMNNLSSLPFIFPFTVLLFLY
jgi:hypothetical protein